MKSFKKDLETLFQAFNHMHHNCIHSELKSRGISEASHPPILFLLRYKAKKSALSQKELADLLGISQPTVAVSVKRMERTGLVCKTADEKDLRRNVISLTEKGMHYVDRCADVINEIDLEMFQNFSEDECEQLKAFYLRMIGNLEKMGVHSPANLKKEL